MLSSCPAAAKRILDLIPPASGAEVMGAGIVSIALSLDGAQTISQILLVIDALTWVALVVLLPTRIVGDYERFRADVRTPAALTAVAASAVLGAQLAMLGWRWAAIVLLVISLLVWAALLVPVLSHWTLPTTGASLMLAVSTESLAVLAAALAVQEHADWLLPAALVAFALGLASYAFVIARFDRRQLAVGRGDQWICGGALAISALAAAKIVTGATTLAILGDGRGILQALAFGLWVLTMLWLPVLTLAEVRHPRPRYTVRRWSTVFPVGMYAACSFAVGVTARAAAVTSYARVWVWVALAIWVIVSAATLHRGWQIVRFQQPPAQITPP
ncbi:MAG TPA: tellurite resistance/C4-dicarboxylate transporter family protein [Solirubrobacteraceae bacterium]